jgi:predicted small lipoprotein YifL
MRMLLILLVLSATVAACGKKPGVLDAPEEGKNIIFPRTYPTK